MKCLNHIYDKMYVFLKKCPLPQIFIGQYFTQRKKERKIDTAKLC